MSGLRIKQFRYENNYSQDELAKLLNVSKRTIARWEQNKSQPHNDELKKITKLIGVSEDEILSNEDIDLVLPEQNYLEKISDSVDNLVNGQDTINNTIKGGYDEIIKKQDELIKELKKQNEDLISKLEETRIQNNIDLDMLKQKKIRNVVLIVTCIVSVCLIAYFVNYYLTNSFDGKFYAGSPKVVQYYIEHDEEG